MQIQNTSPQELEAQRNEYVTLMQNADYRAYELVEPARPARLLDFPLGVPISYVWTGFWNTPAGARDEGLPAVTIATSALADINTLRERLRADRPVVRETELVARLEGRAGVVESPFVLLDSNHVAAQFEDNGTAVVVVARSAEYVPAGVSIRPLVDIQELVEEWKSL